MLVAKILFLECKNVFFNYIFVLTFALEEDV